MISRRKFFQVGSAMVWLPRESLADSDVLPECEWCGSSEAPGGLTSVAVLADADEPGDRLVIRGTVLAPDRVTPVSGVLLYAYNTNAAGIYARRGDETGNGRRHGHLRGWLISDQRGRFEVRTILPGHYPGRNSPRHIHMTVKEPERAEYWIDNVHFDDDPLLTPQERARLAGRGGPGIVTTSRDASGQLFARRDVVLMPPG